MTLDHSATLNSPVVHCPKCGNPMQVMNEIEHAGKITQRTYICGCAEPVFYHTVRY